MTTTCLVVMGVSGSGKSSIAPLLAEQLGWPVSDGDEFHPAANLEKMASGVALTDADRIPWLLAIRDWINACSRSGHNVVVTCSALKRAYRDILREASAYVRFVHLTSPRKLIRRRLDSRSGHFMPSSLLVSQFEDLELLEADEDGITVDVVDSPQQITESVLIRLGLDQKKPPVF